MLIAGQCFRRRPLLLQSAFFRPHNRHEDVRRLHLVGAGMPSVMMSAKMTARVIAGEFGVHTSVVGGAC